MADIDLVINEDGFNYEITVFSGNSAFDLTAFDTNTIDIRPTDFTGALILDSKALTFKTDGSDGILVWPVVLGDFVTQPAGPAYAQLTLIDSGVQTRKTDLMTVMIHRDVA